MQTIIHKADTRGTANHGWLKSYHTFSFANYYNPNRMGFGSLRVINDDIIAPSAGFDMHPHQNMEIISVPISGALKHKDSMGNTFVIKKGEIQAMTAGTGIVHSEYNNSSEEDANFLQIWILPKKMNVNPTYSQKEFFEMGSDKKVQLIVSPDGRNNSVKINQDAFFSLLKLESGISTSYSKYLNQNGIYIFIIAGELKINGEVLNSRDGLGVMDTEDLSLESIADAEVLIMEVPLSEDSK